MAQPQKQPSASRSAVASCSATDCAHNEDRQCHAGEITVRMGANGAECATYAPEGKTKPRP